MRDGREGCGGDPEKQDAVEYRQNRRQPARARFLFELAHCDANQSDDHVQCPQSTPNQALISLMATVFMTVYGKEGLRELALQNLSKAQYLGGKLQRRFSGPYFNEFATVVSDPREINLALAAQRIIGGLPLDRFYPELRGTMLLCCTEMTSRSDMDVVAAALK